MPSSNPFSRYFLGAAALMLCALAMALSLPAAEAQELQALPATPVEDGDCKFARTLPTTDKRAVSPAAANPLTDENWFVDEERSKFGLKGFREPAYGEYRSMGGRKKALMSKVALTPRFFWYGRFSGDSLDPERGLDDLQRRVCTFMIDAQRKNEVPLLTVMRHTGGECNPRYQAGGVREDNAAKRWYDSFAEAIGDSRVILAFEPDSLGTIECLARERRQSRYDLLRYGVERLSQLPNATIYIESGASDWQAASRMASKLRRVGVDKVRGFMLNVTHFDWTDANISYGRQVSRLVGGKHFIINTATNGRGPVHFDRRIGDRNRQIVINCHPLFRGLGPKPTTDTGDPLVDAFMWISRPGYSSGGCNGGPPKVGDWWQKRALQLAANATQGRGPARGTQFGFPRGTFTAKQLSGTQFLRDAFE